MLSPLKRKIIYDSSSSDLIVEPETSSSYILQNNKQQPTNGHLNNGGEKLNGDDKMPLDDNEYCGKIRPCCQKFKFSSSSNNHQNFFVNSNLSALDFSTMILDRRHQQFFVHYLANHCDCQLSSKLITELLIAKKITNCVSVPLIDHILKLPSSNTLLDLFLDVQYEIPEICAVKILKYCIKNINGQDQLDEGNRRLLHKILRKDFSPSLLIDELKFLSYDEATVIVQFLTTCLSRSIFSRDDNANFDRLINFASSLLDAQSTGTFQRCENFRDEIGRLEAVITSTVLMVDLFVKKQELARLKKIGGKNIRNDYCIETLLL